MKTLKYLSLIFLFIAGLMISCGEAKVDPHSHEDGQPHEPHDSGHDDHPEEAFDKNKTTVTLSTTQLDVMGIEFGGFKKMELSGTVKSSGRLELPPQNKASLSALMAGRVEEIYVLQGEYVRKGQTLTRLANPEFISIQENYLKSWNKLQFLEKEYERKKMLFADSIASAKSFQEAESIYLSQVAASNALETKLSMLNIDPIQVKLGKFSKTIPVRSPINGFVQLVEINIGKYVEPMQEMFEIVDNEHIHIDLMVYEQDFGKIKVGQAVLFTLTSRPDSVITGKIFAVGKSFEESPRAVLMHAEIDNKGGNLLPGMYVDARIITSSSRVSAVPDEAIVSDGGLDYIFIKAHSHGEDSHVTFRKVGIKMGVRDLGHCEILPEEKLEDDVEIVVEGAFYLLAEMNKGKGGGHGHSH